MSVVGSGGMMSGGMGSMMSGGMMGGGLIGGLFALLFWGLVVAPIALVTLIEDRLTLPFLATVGFAEVLIVMVVLVFLAGRYQRKRCAPSRVA